MEVVVSVIGWIGAGLVVLAYGLVSTGRIQGTSRIYQVMNLCGAVGVGIQSYTVDAFPSVFLQIVWGTIALVSIYRLLVR